MQNNNAVDQVIVFEKKDLTADLLNPLTLGTKISKIKTLLTTLSANRFDLAIDAQGLLKSAVLAWASGAPVRVGFRGAREGSSALMTDTLDVGDYYGPTRHVVDLNIALGDFALETLARRKKVVLEGAPPVVSFPLPRLESSVQQGLETLLSGGEEASGAGTGSGAGTAARGEAPPVISSSAPPQAISPSEAPPVISSSEAPQNVQNKVVVLIPGTTWATKIWPASKWVELGLALVNSGVSRLIICGGKADAALTQSIYIGIDSQLQNKTTVFDLTAKTDLMQLIALFKMTDIVVGADTGPMHLAVAADRPLVVAVHGSTPWLRNGPYGVRGRAVYSGISCQPCFSKTCLLPDKSISCLTDLEVGKVLQVIAAADLAG
ncbi:MAG: hypothetical protein JSS86_11295 [Cyanobacteria bacterium SZAS LIN-2]|nr:hypothetical protein [Cyanobacteria bacterium SZAS LIN-3]MBS1996891.1 hypothetical protein [Cyanobacteria bacterium SZAS LIN-2]